MRNILSSRFLFATAVTLLLLLAGTLASAWVVMRNNCDEITLSPVAIAAAPEYPPLRIAVISDLHVPPDKAALARLEEIVRRTNAQQPDLILMPGDFLAGNLPHQSAPPEAIAERLGRLRAPLGVYAVLGNHDHFQQPKKLTQAFAANKITLLENRSVLLEHSGRVFCLLGVTDYCKIQKPNWQELLPHPDMPVIVMTHTPDIFATLPPGTILAVASHTHGGQINLPVIGAPVVPSKFGQRYARGTVKENGNTFFITSGLGTSILKLRLNCPPEIALLSVNSPITSAVRPN